MSFNRTLHFKIMHQKQPIKFTLGLLKNHQAYRLAANSFRNIGYFSEFSIWLQASRLMRMAYPGYTNWYVNLIVTGYLPIYLVFQGHIGYSIFYTRASLHRPVSLQAYRVRSAKMGQISLELYSTPKFYSQSQILILNCCYNTS